MAQLMPLPLTVSCFSKIQIGFTCLVLAHLGSRVVIEKRTFNGCVFVCVCVCVRACARARVCMCVCVCACVWFVKYIARGCDKLLIIFISVDFVETWNVISYVVLRCSETAIHLAVVFLGCVAVLSICSLLSQMLRGLCVCVPVCWTQM